jgi:hypothetical protein
MSIKQYFSCNQRPFDFGEVAGAQLHCVPNIVDISPVLWEMSGQDLYQQYLVHNVVVHLRLHLRGVQNQMDFDYMKNTV